MVGAFKNHQFRGFGQSRDECLQTRSGTELVAGAADEELGFGAGFQEIVVVGAVVDRGDGSAKADDGVHPRIRASRAQPHSSSEGKPGKDQWKMEFAIQPVESGANIVDFAGAVVVLTVAESSTAKIKAENRQSEGVQRFHGVEDHFIVQGAPILGMRMGNESGVGRAGRADVEQRFELAGGAFEEERADGGRHLGHGYRVQRGAALSYQSSAFSLDGCD